MSLVDSRTVTRRRRQLQRRRRHHRLSRRARGARLADRPPRGHRRRQRGDDERRAHLEARPDAACRSSRPHQHRLRRRVQPGRSGRRGELRRVPQQRRPPGPGVAHGRGGEMERDAPIGCVASKVLDWEGDDDRLRRRRAVVLRARVQAARRRAGRRSLRRGPRRVVRVPARPWSCAPTCSVRPVGSTSATSCSSRTSTSVGDCGCSAGACATCRIRWSSTAITRRWRSSRTGESTTCSSATRSSRSTRTTTTPTSPARCRPRLALSVRRGVALGGVDPHTLDHRARHPRRRRRSDPDAQVDGGVVVSPSTRSSRTLRSLRRIARRHAAPPPTRRP